MSKSNMDFEYGNLTITCHQCGGTEVLEELITDGRAIYLFNKKDMSLKLHCTKCNVTMEIGIISSEIPDLLIDEEDPAYNHYTDLEIANEELPKESTTYEVL